MLDELSKGKSEIETVKKLFSKIKNEFGEMAEKKRKIVLLKQH